MKAAVLAAAAILMTAGAAHAQESRSTTAAGQFYLRLRGLGVMPDASARISVAGANIGGVTRATDPFVLEAGPTHFITAKNPGEAIPRVTQDTGANRIPRNVANGRLLPPTVTAQYHFDPVGFVHPYVGAGVNYTFFYSPKSALAPIGFKNSFGWALQAGADVPVGDGPYFLNFDVKKVFMGTTVRAAGGTVQASARLNPWLVGAGIGVRF